jgi:hypothetical protein
MKTILLDSTGHNNPYPLADAVIRNMSSLPDTLKKI